MDEERNDEVIDMYAAREEGDAVDVRISVSEELQEHYKSIIKMRDDIVGDIDSPPSQVIAILRLVTDMIKEFAKIQEGLYNSETTAMLQQAIVETLKNSNKKVYKEVMKAFDSKMREMK